MNSHQSEGTCSAEGPPTSHQSMVDKSRARVKPVLLSECHQNLSLPSQTSIESMAQCPPMTTPSTSFSTSSIFSPINLVRKHSCGDLVSRLKSRKLLGVGGNSGDLYRSKISQLLGDSEHLFTRFPYAFWTWYFWLVVQFTLIGIWNILGDITKLLSDSNASPLTSTEAIAFSASIAYNRHLVGILYLSMALLLWHLYESHDKNLIRSVLQIISLYSLSKVFLLVLDYNFVWLPNWVQRYFDSFEPSGKVLNDGCTCLTINLALDMANIVVNTYYHYLLSCNSQAIVFQRQTSGSKTSSTGPSDLAHGKQSWNEWFMDRLGSQTQNSPTKPAPATIDKNKAL